MRIGSITVVRGSGVYKTVEVLTAEGRTLRSEAALAAILDELQALKASEARS